MCWIVAKVKTKIAICYRMSEKKQLHAGKVHSGLIKQWTHHKYWTFHFFLDLVSWNQCVKFSSCCFCNLANMDCLFSWKCLYGDKHTLTCLVQIKWKKDYTGWSFDISKITLIFQNKAICKIYNKNEGIPSWKTSLKQCSALVWSHFKWI